MKDTRTTVLLAGEIAARSTTLRRWLSSRGCHCLFAVSFRDACRRLSELEFDLVLSEYDLPDRTAFPLLDWLEGSWSTLLFASHSRKGGRWLPVIERGKRCLDRPLLQTKDLPDVIEEILERRVNDDAPSAIDSIAFEQVGSQ